MLELYKKRLKNNKGMVLPLLIYTAALFWVAWLLIEQCIDAPRSLRSVVYLLFAIVSIEQLIISWRKFTRVETKVEKDEGAIQNISWQEWQHAMLKNDLSQIPSSVIAVFIISIPIVIALAFIVFKSEIFTTSYITNPEYERFNNYSLVQDKS